MNKFIKKLSDSDWKTQKDGLDEIKKIININESISNQGLNDLI